MSFFQKIQSSLEVQRAKEKFSDNPGHNILEYCNILVQIQVTTNKTWLKKWFLRHCKRNGKDTSNMKTPKNINKKYFLTVFHLHREPR